MDREYSDRLLRTTSAGSVTDSSSPQAVLNAAFDAIIKGDFPAFSQCVSDDVELNISGFGPSDSMPGGLNSLNGTWRGREAVVAATRANFAMLDEQKPEIESMISQDDRIAVLLRETGVLKSNGHRYTVRGVQWFTFANGKIKKIDEIIAHIAA